MEVARPCPGLAENFRDKCNFFYRYFLCIVQGLLYELLDFLSELLWHIADFSIGEKQVAQLIGRKLS